LGYGLTMKEAVMLVYGGLRGAVGLILGLLVEHNEYINAGVKQMIAFHVSGIVILTLLINGQTVALLYNWLDIYPSHQLKENLFRRLLVRLEVECFESSTKHLAKHWFFGDAKLKKIVRCVPNFSSLGFGPGGVPHPTCVCEVRESLDSLAADADQFRESHIQTATLSSKDFREQWQVHKMSKESIRAVADRSEEVLTTIEDDADGVTFNAQGYINLMTRKAFIDPESDADNATPSFYMSARSMEMITKEQEHLGMSPPGFGVEIIASRGVRTIIGLMVDVRSMPQKLRSGAIQVPEADMGTTLSDGLRGSGKLLGLVSGSVGLDCQSGVVHSNGPGGLSQQNMPGGPVQDGEKVLVTVERNPGLGWNVSFRVKSPVKAARQERELRCKLGEFREEELFPTVQMMPGWPKLEASISVPKEGVTCQVSIVSASKLKLADWGPGDMASSDPYCVCQRRGGEYSPEQRQHIITQALQNTSDPVWDFQGRFENVKPGEWLIFAVMDKDVGSDDDFLGSAVLHASDFLANGFDGILQLSHAGTGYVSSLHVIVIPGERSAAGQAQEVSDAQPMLEQAGFTPVLPGSVPQAPKLGGLAANIGAAKVSQANAIVSKLEPEGPPLKGLLKLNYEPLTGADSEGIHEMFHILINYTRHFYREKHAHGLVSELAFTWLNDALDDAEDSSNNEVNAMCSEDFEAQEQSEEPKTQFNGGTNGKDEAQGPPSGKLVSNTSAASAVSRVQKTVAMSLFGGQRPTERRTRGVFEPLVVEYLALESQISKESLWDQLWFQAGRRRNVKAKVEALWAFIEAHQAAIDADNAIDRFPQLIDFMTEVIAKAKEDLKRLSELQPRRFFYAKHALALRIMLQSRLEKLKHLVKEGTMSSGDVSALEEALEQRLMDALRMSGDVWRNMWWYCISGVNHEKDTGSAGDGEPSQSRWRGSVQDNVWDGVSW
jgi:hypothetical protein